MLPFAYNLLIFGRSALDIALVKNPGKSTRGKTYPEIVAYSVWIYSLEKPLAVSAKVKIIGSKKKPILPIILD